MIQVHPSVRRIVAGLGLFLLVCAGCDAGGNTVHTPAHAPLTPHRSATASAILPAGGSTPRQASVSTAWLIAAIDNVGSGSPRFGVRDSTGSSMDTLKVVAYPGGYLGVYHCLRSDRFEVRVATSSDLRRWTLRAVLDTHASQPTLARAAGGGYVLAEEADSGAHAGPGRRFLRFRYYANTARLLHGSADQTFVAPHTLAAPRRGAEGTPNIYGLNLSPDIAHSRVEVGLHYSANGVDREALGVLVDFRSWTTRPDRAFDRALLSIGMRGKHGDRDAIVTTTGTQVVVECQNGSDGIWRLAIYDPRRGTALLLSPRTPGASRSFANPTLTYLRLPDGATAVVITAFIPQTGSSRAENGELVYWRRLPAS